SKPPFCSFDLNDMSDQLRQMEKLGGMGGVMGMLGGGAKMRGQMEAAGIDDKVIRRQTAIISSMTKKERAAPKIIDGKRRRRIAKGSGVHVAEVNKLLKMHRQMADMMKQMGKNKGLMSRMMGGMGGLGGMASGMPPGGEPTPEMVEQAKAAMQSGGGLPGLGGGAMPKGLPGLGGAGLPGLGGGGLPGLGGPSATKNRKKKKRK
ncbi:MAG: hypothetical protein AAFU50_11285, partial [Pseudomonadota bacterium]